MVDSKFYESERVMLAIHGGPRVRTTPINTTGKRFDDSELEELKEALDQQTLFYWSGKKVKTACSHFAQLYGVRYCHMVTSGTAALHVACGALGVSPGDEVITSPITDQGTIIAILAQGAIPVFADVHPRTYTLTANTIERCITSKTKAIIVVHLAGNPADMDDIIALAKRYGIFVIEDCAQSYLCWYRGRLTGTLGDVGCFSLNDFKHISTGDGGLIITNNGELSKRIGLFLDKCYSRTGEFRNPEFLGFNYRPSELIGAVAIAQLRKLPAICEKRNLLGVRLTYSIQGLPGVIPHFVQEGCKSSYWFYMGRVESKILGISRNEFVQAVAAEGVPITSGYLGKLVYEYPILMNHSAFSRTPFPWDNFYGRQIEYKQGLCPIAEEIERTCWRVPITEFMSEQDIDDIAAAIRKVVSFYVA